MYKYYCVMRPPAPGAIPYGPRYTCEFTERRYIPEIERMAWGWLGYDSPLSMTEVAEYELIAAPREDE